MKVCRRCRAARDDTDMATIDDVPYCHPAKTSGETCYMLQARVLAEFWRSARRPS